MKFSMGTKHQCLFSDFTDRMGAYNCGVFIFMGANACNIVVVYSCMGMY